MSIRKTVLLVAALALLVACAFAADAKPATAAPSAAAAAPAVPFEKTEAYKSMQSLIESTKKDALARVSALTEELNKLKAAVDKLSEKVGAVQSTKERVSHLDSIVSQVQAEFGALKQEVADSSLANTLKRAYDSLAKLALRVSAEGTVIAAQWAQQARVYLTTQAGPQLQEARAKASVLAAKYSEVAKAEVARVREQLTVKLAEVGVPKQHAPMAALAIVALALFLATAVALVIVRNVLSCVFWVLCCCPRRHRGLTKQAEAAIAAANKRASTK